MKKLAGIKELLIAAAFALLGGCLLLAAGGILSDADVRRESVTAAGERASLWSPGEFRTVSLSDSEDGHEHTVSVASGGAALVLTSAFDGSRSLAAELARRGVTVLLYGGEDCAGAWRYLKELGRETGGMILLAGSDRADEALALSGALYDSGEHFAGIILLGNEATVRMAADYPGGNLLILTRMKPDRESLTAFYGSEAAAERGFDGFYAEGTARACDWNRWFGSFARREALMLTAGWKGSVLGHAVEIPDGDLIFQSVILCYAGAAICLLLAAGVLASGLRRRIKHI